MSASPTTHPRRRRLRRRDEAGYAAVITAILAASLFMGMAALGVDTARWYVEAERVQKAADAAALAGVTYMPNDLTSARATAIASATKNGYPNSGATSVTVAVGSKPSELKVTITSRISNTFGVFLGVDEATIVRSAVADFTAPAPMGSPCNTFGNEPPSQAVPAAQPAGSSLPTGTAPDGSALPFQNCSTAPGFWAAIEGPNTDKVQGDRFMTTACNGSASPAGTTYLCSGGTNSETRPEGYFWAVHVEPEAVGTPITVQLYDPAFMYTGIHCTNLLWGNSTSLPRAQSAYTAYMNDYASTDGDDRYSAYQWNTSSSATATNSDARKYCSGDYNPGGSGPASDSLTMSFALREANDTYNPKVATPISGCTKQFVGQAAPPTPTELKQWNEPAKITMNAAYNLQKAQLYHQWYPLCTFTPTRDGDYYLQVRTNVTTAGGTAVANTNPNGNTMTSLVYTGNTNVTAATGNTTSGTGLNAFALRAVPSDSSKAQYIAVAGNESMPILQNKEGTAATFNLIKALPGTRGQYIAFDFYDGGDGANSTTNATVKIVAPADATGSIKATSVIPNCKHAKNNAAYTTATNCTVNMRNATHNGQLEHIVIPIPNDYNCNPATLGGCWFSVQITFPSTVTDFTTWTANIGGDPVRLVE